MAQVSIDRALEMAVAHYQAGHWSEAESIYRQVIVHVPNHAIALHRLGILLARQKRIDEAVPLLTRVVQLLPADANAHNDLGSALHDQGHLAEAATVLSRAVQLAPSLPLAHSNFGNVLRSLGKLDEAIASYHRAIQLKPDYAEAYNNLGNAFYDQGHPEDAVAAFRRAIQLLPNFAPAHSNLGVALERLHQSEEAVAAFQRAIQLAPDYVEAYSNLGQSLESLDRADEAMTVYQRALQIQPNFAATYCNVGNLLHNQKRFDESIAAFRRALELEPDMAAAHSNIGNALCDTGKAQDGIASYRHALRLNPNYVDAMSNLASTLINQGQLDEPESLLRRAIEIDPHFPDAHWNLALFLLLQGDFERGLPEYEWRWKVKKVMKNSQPFSQPPWDGCDLHGQTILLHTEQGAGDAIQFIRYIPMVAARGGRIILRCPPELKRLFSQIPLIDKLVDSTQPIPEFDFQCPLLSLPLAFNTRLDSIPATVPYLKADPALVEKWKNKLTADGNARRIGLVWAGASYHTNNRNRSTQLASFAPLADVKNAVFYSLQKGEPAKDPPPVGLSLIDFTSDLNDFADTAALIANLDLIIAVDTSVAHLAGAMAKPVWVVLPCNPDWRWMYHRADSPWYPTMRLFRQTKLNDWSATMTQVARQLAELEKIG